jgi:hypothetical protein
LTTDLVVDFVEGGFMRCAPLILSSVTALLISCGSEPTVPFESKAADLSAGGSGPRASSHVERGLAEFGVTIEKYSFTAHHLGSGEVGGRFQVRDVFADGSEQLKVKGEVTCFTVEPDGKTARMGGIVDGGDPSFAGTEAAWTVRDNGEGNNDPPDEATDLRFGLPPGIAETHCTVGFPPEAFGTFGPSERGNVQVRP